MGTLWCNGTIYTMETDSDFVEAVFVENGVIVDAGSTQEIRDIYKSRINEEINLEGGYMFPGFIDSHLHLIGHGEKLLQIDLSKMTSVNEIIKCLEEKVASAKEGEWIRADGWNENIFTDSLKIDRYILNKISTIHPIILSRICRHAIVVNSLALKIAGIDNATVAPEGGVIERDSEGIPTGVLIDNAQQLVKDFVPSVSHDYITRAINCSIQDLLQNGFVGAHTEDLNYYNGFQETFQPFLNIIDGVKMKFRAHILVHHEVIDDMTNLGYQYGAVAPFVQIGAMKIFADGSLGGRTALLKEAYSDATATNGVAIQSLEELKELVFKARIFEMPVAIHAIGDLALQNVLDAIEAYPVKDGLRDRIIHGQIVNEDLIQRLRNLPVVIDIQPIFVASDFPWVLERLGENRANQSYVWKTFLEEGLLCAGGSDAPIESINPLLGIHAAITRRKPEEKHVGYNPSQKLTAFEAIKLYTGGSAAATCEEDYRGLIKKGYLADFTVFDRNLLDLDHVDELLHANVLMTVVDDTVMYKKSKICE